MPGWEKANLPPLIFIRADCAICSPRQRGAGGGTGEPGKLLSAGEARPGRSPLARSNVGQGGISQHPVPTPTTLGKWAAHWYRPGKAVPVECDAQSLSRGMAQPGQAASPSPSKQPVGRLGRWGNAGHPNAPSGLAWSPPRKPRARGEGGVREVGTGSPAVTQRKENTTRRRINSSARG